MKTSALLMNFSVDKENRKINVEREFAAPLAKVWAAWTQSELLDQWWAPKPWKARTKIMNFRPGGQWLYAMVGPSGETHWSKAQYISLVPMKKFICEDMFCDENGNPSKDFPTTSDWSVEFLERSGTTQVNIEISFKKLEDLEQMIQMGFREGFTAGMENLDELLK
jgi:uncharacterized protein YndB with AHSA1/START domain